MSREHRFCAEIYARLFALIDRTERIVVNPDGQAILDECPRGRLVPDLCFTLCGINKRSALRARLLRKSGFISNPIRSANGSNLAPAS